MNIRLRYIFSALLVLTVFQLSAKVSLPRFISDGVVLQRNVKIPVWGWADVGEVVEVNFNGKVYKAKTGANGKWKLLLSKQHEVPF